MKNKLDKLMKNLSDQIHTPFWQEELKKENKELYNYIINHIKNIENKQKIGLNRIRSWFVNFGLPLEKNEGLCASKYSSAIKYELLLRNEREIFDNFLSEWIELMKKRQGNDNKLINLWDKYFNEEMTEFEANSLKLYILASKGLYNLNQNSIITSKQLLDIMNNYKNKIDLSVDDFKLRYEDSYPILTNVLQQNSLSEFIPDKVSSHNKYLYRIKKSIKKSQKKEGAFHSNQCYKNSIEIFKIIEDLKNKKLLPDDIKNELYLGKVITPIGIGPFMGEYINKVEYCFQEVRHAWNSIDNKIIDVSITKNGYFSKNNNVNNLIIGNKPNNFKYFGLSFDKINKFKEAKNKKIDFI